jgi:hypothetical protein
VLTALWMLAGGTGVLYALLFLIVSLPGWPLGFALFGRRHLAGWLAGVLLGYAVTSFAWWAVIYTGHPSGLSVTCAWAASGAVIWLAVRTISEPLIILPRWTKRDSVALALLLLMVPALVTRPLDRIGEADAQGNHQYRAYFIADFVWHAALTAELEKQAPKPINPFLAPEPVHYYWTYFRVPATIAADTGIDVQRVLKLNALLTALLLLSSIYLAAWTALPAWPLTTALAVALTVLGPSAEGLASIAELLRQGQPLSGLRDLNIDAVAAWAFKGLRIDNLPRTMWYTPQHAFSLALGLLAIPATLGGGVRARASAILLTGCALSASLAFNPLLGVGFCAIYGVTILADAIAQRATVQDLFRHALAVLPVLAAFAWCTFNAVGEGAGGVLHFGFWGPARNATLLNLALQLGPILLAMAVGLWPGRHEPVGRVWPAIAGAAVGLLVMHLVTLTVDQAWVGFRGGNLFLVSAPPLVAIGLARLWTSHARRLTIGLVAMIVIVGVPTTIIDAYNAQDVSNRDICCGDHVDFHWTVVVTAAEQEALDWIRTHTPVNAVVQAEPTIRGRETWSLIPTFAERRMATGVAIPLLPVPAYAERNAIVKTIYESDDARAAWTAAEGLGISFLYVDRTERAAYPNVRKFDEHPEYFEPVFRNDEVRVYGLRP